MSDTLIDVTAAGTGSAIDAGIAAARSGDIAGLQAWLDAGNSPNRNAADGWTPLLWAAARGHNDVVMLLLDRGADPALPHGLSKALPIHMAGHSGDVATAETLLARAPDHLDAVWDLNGHTILLQAVFYAHVDLAKVLVARGADTSITTARGLGPLELAAQFQNQTLVEIIRPHDSPAAAKAAYYASYLQRIAPVVPPEQAAQQQLADQLVGIIADGIQKAATDPGVVDLALAAVRFFVEVRKADVNRLGGPLQQPPLIVAVTGNNGFPPNPAVARLRNEVAKYLLDHGADPTLHEEHPMGAQTVIRAAVFNHLDILKAVATYITPERLADAINEIPVVNGLTALHDTVLRATTAAPDRFEGYLDQTRWFVSHGGRSDIEDFSGRTQRKIAEDAPDETVRRRLLEILNG